MIYGPPDQLSGGYRYDRHLAAALVAAGHSVNWVSLARAARYRRERHGDPSGLWVNETVGLEPDLVLIDELNHAPVIDGISDLRRRAPGAAVVAMVHHLRRDEPGHDTVDRWLATLRERRFLRRCDAWLVNGDVTRLRVRRVSRTVRPTGVALPGSDGLSVGAPTRDADTGRTRTRSSATRHQAGHAAAPPIAPFPGPPWRLLFVGSVIRRKNIDRLIRAAARLPQLHLDIVGDAAIDPGYTDELHALIGRAGIAERVTFHGPLAAEELAERFATAHLFAAPSWYEGYGIVYAEALLSGLPTIAGERGGAAEVLGPGLQDWLVDPTSTGALAELIGRITSSTDAWRAACRRAWRRAERLPLWAPSMRGAVRFLESVYRARNVSNS